MKHSVCALCIIVLFGGLAGCLGRSSVPIRTDELQTDEVKTQEVQADEVQNIEPTADEPGQKEPILNAFASVEEANQTVTEVGAAPEQCEIIPQTHPESSIFASDKMLSSEAMPPALAGARRVFATVFQSCDAIDFIYDQEFKKREDESSAKACVKRRSKTSRFLQANKKETYIQSHPILSRLNELSQRDPREYPVEGCKNILSQPPIYGFGAKPKIRKREIDVLQKANGGTGVPASDNGRATAPVSAIDCSGFITTAFAAAGLKFETSQTSPQEAIGTTNTARIHSLASSSSSRTSCLQVVKPEGSSFPLQAGDLINFPNGHVVMLNRVGQDPFGVNGISNIGDCSGLMRDKFDFDYIHSGSYPYNAGVSRVDARVMPSGTMLNNMQLIAAHLCERKFSQHAKLPALGIKIIRHQSSKEGCTTEPASLKGEDCLDCLRGGQSKGVQS